MMMTVMVMMMMQTAKNIAWDRCHKIDNFQTALGHSDLTFHKPYLTLLFWWLNRCSFISFCFLLLTSFFYEISSKEAVEAQIDRKKEPKMQTAFDEKWKFCWKSYYLYRLKNSKFYGKMCASGKPIYDLFSDLHAMNVLNVNLNFLSLTFIVFLRHRRPRRRCLCWLRTSVAYAKPFANPQIEFVQFVIHCK